MALKGCCFRNNNEPQNRISEIYKSREDLEKSIIYFLDSKDLEKNENKGPPGGKKDR